MARTERGPHPYTRSGRPPVSTIALHASETGPAGVLRTNWPGQTCRTSCATWIKRYGVDCAPVCGGPKLKRPPLGEGGRYGRANTGGGLTTLSIGRSSSSLSDFSKKRRALVKHLRAYALRTDGPFRLRSGAVASWYLDARQTTFDGAGAQAVAAAVLEALDERVQAVGGMTMGADPIAVATAMSATQSGRPMRSFSIRKEVKSHGAGGRLVGPVNPGDAVAILEDTTTTGGALLEALEVAVSSGLHVVQAIALVDRSGGAVRDRMARAGIAYLALITPEDLGVAE